MPLQVSVAIPCYNEEESLPYLKSKFFSLPLFTSGRLELILVDDGSKDSTWDQISALALENENITAAKLSRNCGNNKAMLAGISLAQGGVIGVMDADLQDPPELLDEMLKRIHEGASAAIGLKIKRSEEPLLAALKTFATCVFPIPAGEGDFCLMKRSLAQDLLFYAQENLPFRNRRYWSLKGHPVHYVKLERQSRSAGSTKWNLAKLARLWCRTAKGYLSAGARMQEGWKPPFEKVIRGKISCPPR